MDVNENRYFYEPAKGLSHDPLNAIIGPRPIGWISTRGLSGALNLAPYSFFNAFNYHPPIIGFSSVGAKDSLRNAEETGEFVWNLATRDLAEAMNATSVGVPYEANEFERAGLTPTDSRTVSAPRVAESPVNFECKVTQIIRLQDQHSTPVETWLILGEVIGVHIAPGLLNDGVFDTFGAGIILRAGGPSSYATILPENRFDMFRPQA
jgi:flavin reductase (DIM6/NTAB) family NADH-FMN oxidoreductase RutF